MTDPEQPPPDLPRAEFLRSQLRAAITQARVESGLSQKNVAQSLAWSVSKVSRVESGFVAVSPGDVRALFSLLGAKAETMDRYADMALEARAARSWGEFSDVMSSNYMNFIGMEQSAAEVLKYETGLIPGLFQTRGYTASLFQGTETSPPTARRLTEVRQLRQRILDMPDCPDLTIVVGELALVRSVGGSSVMRQQIDWLVRLSTHEKISLFLMPFEAGPHPGMGVPFTVLRFREEGLPSALYLEDGLRQITSGDDEDMVEQHYQLFMSLIERAERSGPFTEHAERIVNQYFQE